MITVNVIITRRLLTSHLEESICVEDCDSLCRDDQTVNSVIRVISSLVWSYELNVGLQSRWSMPPNQNVKKQ